MGGMGEHIQHSGAFQPVTKAVDQFADIAGQGGGMAGNIDDPPRPQRRYPGHQFQRAGPGRIEQNLVVTILCSGLSGQIAG